MGVNHKDLRGDLRAFAVNEIEKTFVFCVSISPRLNDLFVLILKKKMAENHL